MAWSWLVRQEDAHVPNCPHSRGRVGSSSGEGLSVTVQVAVGTRAQGRLQGEEALLLGSLGFERGTFERTFQAGGPAGDKARGGWGWVGRG